MARAILPELPMSRSRHLLRSRHDDGGSRGDIIIIITITAIITSTTVTAEHIVYELL
jgi:hypothetical protein